MSQVTPPQTETLNTVLAFIARRGITEKTFGAYAVNDSSFVDRLRVGKATFAIGQRALEYIAGQDAAAVRPSSTETAAGGCDPGSSSPQGDSPMSNGSASCRPNEAQPATPSRKMMVA